MALQKKISVSVMLVAVVAVATGSLGGAYAQESGMSITATAQDGSDTITLTGRTVPTISDVTIRVEAPENRNVVFVGQVAPDPDGKFEKEIKIGDLWTRDGDYTIHVNRGEASLQKLSVKVRIMDGTTLATDATQSTFGDTMVFQGSGTPEMRGLALTADAMEGSDTITIIGSTDRMQFPITLKGTAPNGNVISVDQASPDPDGDFSIDIKTGGNLWSQDGNYTITATQGENANYQDSVQVEIIDGLVIPEFGTIAALVLAAAIASIIAVSARSRLSIMPKY